MLQEEFGPHAIATYQSTRWIEPIWKLLLSNKGILPILWQLYPNHELLLEAHFDTPTAKTPDNTGGWQDVVVGGSASTRPQQNVTPTGPGNLRDYVRKPLMSREGANITLVRNNATVASTERLYYCPQIYQALAPDAVFSTPNGVPRYPILGLWMIDQDCCGLGIRESDGPITGNLSSFIPHFFI